MRLGGRNAIRLVSALTGSLTITLLCGSAVAGDWKLTDSVTASATVVDRTGRAESSGTIFQLSPRLHLTGRGARAQADINYELTASTGTGSTDPRPFSHNLLARGKVEAIEDFFFIGANASARMAGSSATSGPVDSINARSDGTQTYSLQISPEFRHRLNRYANIVSLNQINYVTRDSTSSVSSDSSRSTTLNIGVHSGPYFGPLNWNLDATQRRTNYDDRDDKNTHYLAGVGYRFDRQWRARGTVGYEENEVQSTRRDTDGGTWSVGADWTPNPRTSVSADYGRRYHGQTFSASAKHRTRRTTLSMDLSRDVSNRRTAELVDQFFFLVDQNGNIVVDPFSGAPIIANIPELRQTDEDFINTRLRGVATITGLRTNVTLTGTLSNRDYEVSSAGEDSYGVSLRVTRKLTGDISATASGSYTSTDVENGSESDTYDISLSLNRRISRRTSASINLLHRDQDTSATNGGYTENRIGISVTSSFL